MVFIKDRFFLRIYIFTI